MHACSIGSAGSTRQVALYISYSTALEPYETYAARLASWPGLIRRLFGVRKHIWLTLKEQMVHLPKGIARLRLHQHEQVSRFFNDGAIAVVKLALAAIRHYTHDNTDCCTLHVVIDLLMLILAGVHTWSCLGQTSGSPVYAFSRHVVRLLTVPRHQPDSIITSTPGDYLSCER